ncbi:hypothetical protein [Flavobacterium gelatinilyticum]|uniref:hypothetical protein n=1 Tax=Flavobacterium gelatinilyticum TaxID=3003260 RepID=UPI00247FD92A|nr:hypothetical protein [Flavobacterium gelatinilyticum]
MKYLLYITLLICYSYNVTGQNLKPEYQKFIQSFITDIKADRKEAIASAVQYPLKRENPIPSVKNKADFIKRYSEIFDADLKKEIISSNIDKDWQEMGWRGIMLNSGTIWFDLDGKLTAVNYESKYEKDLKTKLILSQKKKLHSSIAVFKEPVYVLETSKFRIRIDDLGNNKYRYASWSVKKSMSEKPDLVIQNGKLIADGTAGNHQYEFKKGNYVYQCAIIILGEKDAAPARLVIYQNGKEILMQDAKIVSR